MKEKNNEDTANPTHTLDILKKKKTAIEAKKKSAPIYSKQYDIMCPFGILLELFCSRCVRNKTNNLSSTWNEVNVCQMHSPYTQNIYRRTCWRRTSWHPSMREYKSTNAWCFRLAGDVLQSPLRNAAPAESAESPS